MLMVFKIPNSLTPRTSIRLLTLFVLGNSVLEWKTIMENEEITHLIYQEDRCISTVTKGRTEGVL